MSAATIPYPLAARPVKGGPLWLPYAVAFDSPEGEFEVHVYAVSRLHAQLQVEALRETARVVGVTTGAGRLDKGENE